MTAARPVPHPPHTLPGADLNTSYTLISVTVSAPGTLACDRTSGPLCLPTWVYGLNKQSLAWLCLGPTKMATESLSVTLATGQNLFS